MRRGHRGAAEALIRVARRGAVNLTARRGEVHRGRAVVGKARKPVRSCRGGHGDDVRARVTAGIVRRHIGIGRFIARRRHKQNARRVRGIDLRFERLREAAAAPGIRGQVHPDACGIGRGLHRVRSRATAARRQEFQAHERHLPVHAGHTRAVVAHAADAARAVRAVVVVIHRVVVVVREIPAPRVIDVAISIVVEAVRGDFAGIRPHVRHQIRMRVVDARVDHADQHCTAARAQIPSLRRVDVRIRRATALPRIMKPPQLAKTRVIRQHAGVHEVIRLRHERQIACAGDFSQHARHRIEAGIGKTHQPEPGGRFPIPHRGPKLRQGLHEAFFVHAGPHFHHHVIRHVGRLPLQTLIRARNAGNDLIDAQQRIFKIGAHEPLTLKTAREARNRPFALREHFSGRKPVHRPQRASRQSGIHLLRDFRNRGFGLIRLFFTHRPPPKGREEQERHGGEGSVARESHAAVLTDPQTS